MNGSINNTIGENATIDFNAIRDLSNGRFNMGEIVGEADKNGKFTFKSINSHVGCRHGRNNVRTTVEQNRATNMAVFKALLAHYAAETNRRNEIVQDDAEVMSVDEVLARDISREGEMIEQELGHYQNPYIREAFRYLLLDGNDKRPLSRDELHRLIELLEGQGDGKSVEENISDLKGLRRFKQYGDGADQNVFRLIKGLQVEGITNEHRARVLAASRNQGGYDFDLDGLKRFAGEFCERFQPMLREANPGAVQFTADEIAKGLPDFTRRIGRGRPANAAELTALHLAQIFRLVDHMDKLREMVWNRDVSSADLNAYLSAKIGTVTHSNANAAGQTEEGKKLYILNTVVTYVRQMTEAIARLSKAANFNTDEERNAAFRSLLAANDGACVELRFENIGKWLNPEVDDDKPIKDLIFEVYDEVTAAGGEDDVLCRKFREKLAEKLVGKRRPLVYLERARDGDGRWAFRSAKSSATGAPLLQTVTEAYIREQADLFYEYINGITELTIETEAKDLQEAVADERVVPQNGGVYDYENEVRTLAGTLRGDASPDAAFVDEVRGALERAGLLPRGNFDLQNAVAGELERLRDCANYGADYGQFIDPEFRDALTNRERLVRLIAGRIGAGNCPQSELIRANLPVSALKVARYINNDFTLCAAYNSGKLLSAESLADRIANAIYSISRRADELLRSGNNADRTEGLRLKDFLNRNVNPNGTLKCVPGRTDLVANVDENRIGAMMKALVKMEQYANPAYDLAMGRVDSETLRRLNEHGVTLEDVDGANPGGSVLFSSPAAIRLLNKALDALDRPGWHADDKQRKLVTIALCKNLEWILKAGLTCCCKASDDRYQALEALAAAFAEDDGLLVFGLIDRLRSGEEVFSHPDIQRLAWLAGSVGKIRGAHASARLIVTYNRLDGLLAADDPLLAPDEGPFADPANFFDVPEAEAEAYISRARFLQYRLAMLRAVNVALDRGMLAREDLTPETLNAILSGQTDVVSGNAELKQFLDDVALQTLSGLPVLPFFGSLCPFRDGLAAEFLKDVKPEARAAHLKNIFEREFRANIASGVRFGSPAQLEEFLGRTRKKFERVAEELAWIPDRYIETLDRKRINIFSDEVARLREAGQCNLCLLADLAQGDFGSERNLIDTITSNLDGPYSNRNLVGDEELSPSDERLLDFVRARLMKEASPDQVRDAFNALRRLVDDAVVLIWGEGGAEAMANGRTGLVNRLVVDSAGQFYEKLGQLATEDGIAAFEKAWRKTCSSVVSRLRLEAGKLCRGVDRRVVSASRWYKMNAGRERDVRSSYLLLENQFSVQIDKVFVAALLDPTSAEEKIEKVVRLRKLRNEIIQDYAARKEEADPKQNFTNWVMRRILSNLSCQVLKSRDRVQAIENAIRKELDEDSELWRSVLKVRQLLTKPGRVRASCDNETLRAVVELMTRAYVAVWRCAGEMDLQEPWEIVNICVGSILFGEPEVADAFEAMVHCEEWKRQYKDFVLTEGKNPSPEICRILTGRDHSDERDVQILSNYTEAAEGWHVYFADEVPQAETLGPVQVAKGFRPPLPDLADETDVDESVVKAYPREVEDETFETAQKVDYISSRGRAEELFARFGTALNETLAAQAGGEPRPLGETFLEFIKKVCGRNGEFLRKLLDNALAGPEGADRSLENGLVVRTIMDGLANGAKDAATYKMLRGLVRQVFTDAAAKLLDQENKTRTPASDVVMAFWSMADQALDILATQIPEPDMTDGSERKESEFFAARQTELRSRAQVPEEADVQGPLDKPDTGTWKEQGFCEFLAPGSGTDRRKIHALRARLLLGSPEHVSDVRTDGTVILFKPVVQGKEGPASWDGLFGKDWSKVPEETKMFFRAYANLSEREGAISPEDLEGLFEATGSDDDLPGLYKAYKIDGTTMPRTPAELVDTFKILAEPLVRRVRAVGGEMYSARLRTALGEVYASYGKGRSKGPDELRRLLDLKLEDLRQKLPKDLKDLVLGVQLLLDHALDRMAEASVGLGKFNDRKENVKVNSPVVVETDPDAGEEPRDEEDSDDDDDDGPLDNS